MDKFSALALGQHTITQEAKTLQHLADGLDESFWAVAQRIASCSGLMWVTGVGTSAAVGLRFAHILTDSGIRAVFLPPDLGLHGHSSVMAPGEILAAVSRGGESVEVNQMVAIANERGLTTIAFVGVEDSSLASVCQQRLLIASPAEYELGGYCATTSTVAFSAMCDALSAVVLQMTGYTREAFQRTHPGGAVGQRSYPGSTI